MLPNWLTGVGAIDAYIAHLSPDFQTCFIQYLNLNLSLCVQSLPRSCSLFSILVQPKLSFRPDLIFHSPCSQFLHQFSSLFLAPTFCWCLRSLPLIRSDHFFHSLSQPQSSFHSVFISMFSFSAQVKSSLNPVPILLAREFHLQLMFTIPQFSSLSLFSSPSQPQLSLILSLHTGTTQLSRKGPMTNLMHLLHWTWIANATTNMMHRKNKYKQKCRADDKKLNAYVSGHLRFAHQCPKIQINVIFLVLYYIIKIINPHWLVLCCWKI